MKGREGVISKAVTRSNSTTTDLLVCFPSHLTLLSKPISSPSPSTRSSFTRSQPSPLFRTKPSPLFRTKPKPKSKPKPKPLGPCDFAEPTSPKVTCAGQIKINNRSLPCSKRPNWVETLRLKHDVMHFITCLRGLRFHMRCFGSFNHGSVDDNEEDDDDEGSSEEENNEEDEAAVDEMAAGGSESDSSKDIFSKWFMIIEEKQSTINGVHGMEDDEGGENMRGGRSTCDIETSIPPKNALLLMRCRSAPAKSWLEEREEEEEEEKKKNKKEAEIVSEEERKEKEKKEKLILMRYGPDYWKISTDIAKETWVVGRSDPFSRSRSWRR